MATDWGLPPWEIEDTAPVHWFEKWRAYRFAKARREEVESKKWQTKKS